MERKKQYSFGSTHCSKRNILMRSLNAASPRSHSRQFYFHRKQGMPNILKLFLSLSISYGISNSQSQNYYRLLPLSGLACDGENSSMSSLRRIHQFHTVRPCATQSIASNYVCAGHHHRGGNYLFQNPMILPHCKVFYFSN